MQLSWHFAVWFGGMKQSALCGLGSETCLAAIPSSLVLVYTLNNLSPVLHGTDYA